MLFDLFESVTSTVGSVVSSVTDPVLTVVAPGSEPRLEWDSEEGRLKIKIKDRTPFNPGMH